MEGYLWDEGEPRKAFDKAINNANKVAMSLSDVFCVDMHRESFKDFIKSEIDYVFCNEDELNSLTLQSSTNESFKYFEEIFPKVKELICTLGSDGAVILKNGEDILLKLPKQKLLTRQAQATFLQQDISMVYKRNFLLISQLTLLIKCCTCY